MQGRGTLGILLGTFVVQRATSLSWLAALRRGTQGGRPPARTMGSRSPPPTCLFSTSVAPELPRAERSGHQAGKTTGETTSRLRTGSSTPARLAPGACPTDNLARAV